MKHREVLVWGIILFVLTFFSLNQPAQSAPVEYARKWIGGLVVNIVQVDLRSPNIEITPSLAYGNSSVYLKRNKGRNFPLESFNSLIQRTLPAAAINGTYHDTKTGRIVGTIVINNKIATIGERGAAVCFDKQNHMSLHLVSGKNGKNLGWSSFKSAISTGPTLIHHGQIWLHPRKEYFKDPKVYQRARRSAIALTGANKLLLITIEQKITLWGLAKILTNLGAEEAVALDGGTSSALYYKGRVITQPSRRLSNFLLVYERSPKTTLAKAGQQKD